MVTSGATDIAPQKLAQPAPVPLASHDISAGRPITLFKADPTSPYGRVAVGTTSSGGTFYSIGTEEDVLFRTPAEAQAYAAAKGQVGTVVGQSYAVSPSGAVTPVSSEQYWAAKTAKEQAAQAAFGGVRTETMLAPKGAVLDVQKAVSSGAVPGYVLETPKGKEYFLTEQAANIRAMQLAPKPGEPGYHATTERPLGLYQPRELAVPRITPPETIFREGGYPTGAYLPKPPEMITQPVYNISRQITQKSSEFAEFVFPRTGVEVPGIFPREFMRGAVKGAGSVPEMFGTSIYGTEMIIRDVAKNKGAEVAGTTLTGLAIMAAGMKKSFTEAPIETAGTYAGQALVFSGIGGIKAPKITAPEIKLPTGIRGILPRRTVVLETELKTPEVRVVPESAYGTYTPIEISPIYSRIGVGAERSRVVLPSEVIKPEIPRIRMPEETITRIPKPETPISPIREVAPQELIRLEYGRDFPKARLPEESITKIPKKAPEPSTERVVDLSKELVKFEPSRLQPRARLPEETIIRAPKAEPIPSSVRGVQPSELVHLYPDLSAQLPTPKGEVFPYGRFSKLSDRLSTPTEGLTETPKVRITEAPKPSEVSVGRGLVQMMEPPKEVSIGEVRTVDLSKELLISEEARPISEYRAPSFVQKDLQAMIEGQRLARETSLSQEAARYGFTTAMAGTVLITKQEPKQVTKAKQISELRTVDLSKELVIPESIQSQMVMPVQPTVQRQRQVTPQDYGFTPIQVPREVQVSPQEPVQIPIQITPQTPVQITPQVPFIPQFADTSTVARYYGVNPADINLFQFTDITYKEIPGIIDERKKRKARGKRKEAYTLGYRATPLIEPLAGIKDLFKSPKYKRTKKSKKAKK